MTCVEEDGDLGELKRLIVLPLGSILIVARNVGPIYRGYIYIEDISKRYHRARNRILSISNRELSGHNPGAVIILRSQLDSVSPGKDSTNSRSEPRMEADAASY